MEIKFIRGEEYFEFVERYSEEVLEMSEEEVRDYLTSITKKTRQCLDKEALYRQGYGGALIAVYRDIFSGPKPIFFRVLTEKLNKDRIWVVADKVVKCPYLNLDFIIS